MVGTGAWNGKKVVIIGAARQGIALARYLASHGARVVLTDQKPASEFKAAIDSLADLDVVWVCGGHPLSLLESIDLLCVSGGVPLGLPLIEEATRRGISLSNDSQIFMEAVPCKVIGITGSAGKTTTTTLVGRIAQAALEFSKSAYYRQIWVGGNIGTPLISMVDEMKPDDLAIVEFSSFQLEIMHHSPQISAVLNVTPNHLDRHGTMQAYSAAKARILEFQLSGDAAILGRDDPGAWALAAKVRGQLYSFGFSELPKGKPGIFLQGEKLYLRLPDGLEEPVMGKEAIELRGEHNVLNVMAACAIAAAAGLPIHAMQKSVAGFRGVTHRLEFVRSWGGADWYNDSIATAPERSMAAIRSFQEPLVLLAGGRDKNLPWDDFADLVRQRVDHLIVFGEAADKILTAMDLSGKTATNNTSSNNMPTVRRCSNLQEAVQVAAQTIRPGDVVLLSPGGTSFDEFKDFEERGKCFAQWVKELA
ncbi:MAG: UDP-N-acetylmuramoyl-L-alanine--D-glutamate ligase [Methanothrix sp.]|nr:UDP-N-acetylmuramoyl-L-alanine--D-glutamate ligase [Methanothrix sp.]